MFNYAEYQLPVSDCINLVSLDVLLLGSDFFLLQTTWITRLVHRPQQEKERKTFTTESNNVLYSTYAPDNNIKRQLYKI